MVFTSACFRLFSKVCKTNTTADFHGQTPHLTLERMFSMMSTALSRRFSMASIRRHAICYSPPRPSRRISRRPNAHRSAPARRGDPSGCAGREATPPFQLLPLAATLSILVLSQGGMGRGEVSSRVLLSMCHMPYANINMQPVTFISSIPSNISVSLCLRGLLPRNNSRLSTVPIPGINPRGAPPPALLLRRSELNLI